MTGRGRVGQREWSELGLLLFCEITVVLAEAEEKKSRKTEHELYP